jgi:predicted acylesterase/phospholipase RssA
VDVLLRLENRMVVVEAACPDRSAPRCPPVASDPPRSDKRLIHFRLRQEILAAGRLGARRRLD